MLIAKNGKHTRRERSLESKETLLNIAFFIFYLHPQIMEEMKTTIFSINNNKRGEDWKYSLGLDQGNGFDLEK